MEKDEPLQILPLLAAMTGILFTVTLEIAGNAETHPAVLVPVTE